MKVLVTGASGFLGSALVRSLLAEPSPQRIVATDLTRRPLGDASDRLRWISGGLDDPTCLDEIFAERFDLVYHLASVPGGLAERERALGRRVNLDATLNLFDRLADGRGHPRVVYASSVAVYGQMGDASVSSRTPPRPTISYGAQKRMMEIALADLTRRDELSGIALRLPGIVARPSASKGFGSAFMSDLLRAGAAGVAYVCPVSPNATCWWMSANRAVKNLRHAAAIDSVGEIQLPALRLSVADVVDAMARTYGEACRSLIHFEPDAGVEAVFGRYPQLDTHDEEALGFAHDGSASELIAASPGSD